MINKLYWPWVGGVERVVQQIAEGLNARINADIDADKRRLLYGDLTYRTRGAIFNVYNKLGPGHKENIYQKAFEEELKKCGLSFEKEKTIDVTYEGKNIGLYRPDFIIEGKVIVEIKALPFLGRLEKKQIWTYLKGSGYRLALLVNFGGPKLQIERIIYDLARSHSRESVDNNLRRSALNQRESASITVEVLCCQNKGKGKEEEINGVKVHRASSFGIFRGMPISFSFFGLFKKLSKEADIIDFHHPFPLGDLAIFLFKPKIKLIVRYHSDIVRQKVFGFLVKPLILHTLKRAQKIIVSNPNLIKNSPYLKKFKEKCQVIPFGVDLKEVERFLDEKEVKKIREKYGDFVLFVGRLNYYKGVQYLIEAMKNIKANLVLIGEGPRKKNLEFRIKNLGLKDRIYFLPPQERKRLINFYKASKVFVLPSIFKSEAFGIVLIEAMACGTPVVSTELGTGTSWVNINGKTGFVVPPRNLEALKEAVKKILENKKMAQELGRNASKRVEEKFSLDKMLEETEKVYKSVIPF